MKVIVTCKAVPNEQDIVVGRDGELSFDRAAWQFGTYDLSAVEAGRQVVDAAGGELVGLSVGGPVLETPKLKKDILSRGLDGMYVVAGEGLDQLDTHQTAQGLAGAVRAIGGYDLILAGAGSSDVYAQEVGNQLGALLGVPVVNGVSAITPEGDKVIVERTLDGEIQVLEVPLPAVLSVTASIASPRIPGMKDILAANKKPLTTLNPADVGAPGERTVEVLSTKAPQRVERRGIVIDGDSDESVDEFIALLTAELR
jgi:electron transfer flavoprotein beta subunit